jgi:Raf kinase inhibitor-like YbhB/YbcL family protein
VPTPTAAFALTSADIRQGGAIPRRFTCDGADVSPAIAWTGLPEGTRSVALVLDDPDARNFAHWLAYAIPANMTHLAENAGSPATQFMQQGTNDFGAIGYGGPCPPSGTHHYRFTLYALADALGVSGGARASAVRAAIDKATVLGKVTLTATYAR